MARRPRGGRRDEIARAILEEFGVETADEAQEALRQILGPTIEAMLRCFRQDRSFMGGTQNFQAWHCKFSCSARHAA